MLKRKTIFGHRFEINVWSIIRLKGSVVRYMHSFRPGRIEPSGLANKLKSSFNGLEDPLLFLSRLTRLGIFYDRLTLILERLILSYYGKKMLEIALLR